MAISIKKIKKRSLVNKITINSDVHFKTVKTLLKEHLCLLRDLHIHRYKFFVSYGLFLEHINLSVVKDLKNNFENLRF
jgi:hypothetical protein